jgi:hypothetical protein
VREFQTRPARLLRSRHFGASRLCQQTCTLRLEATPMKKPPVKARQDVNYSDSAEFKRHAIALWKADQLATHKSENSAKALGVALLKVKAHCPHSEFKPWLEQNKIDRNRATYCMRVANGKHHAKRASEKKKATVPEGFKKASILLTIPMYERLALIAKKDGVEFTKYLSNIVMEHAKAQEEAETKIKDAIATANREREQAIEQEKVRTARAEAKKKEDALVAKTQQRAAAQQKAAAATA